MWQIQTLTCKVDSMHFCGTYPFLSFSQHNVWMLSCKHVLKLWSLWGNLGILWNRIFHHKLSILGYRHFRKPPNHARKNDMGGNCRDIALGKIQCVRDRDMKSINMFPHPLAKNTSSPTLQRSDPIFMARRSPFFVGRTSQTLPLGPWSNSDRLFPWLQWAPSLIQHNSSSLGDIEATLGLGDGSRSVFLGDAEGWSWGKCYQKKNMTLWLWLT